MIRAGSRSSLPGQQMAGGSSDDSALTPVELMRRYLDSLPQDFSVREELRSPKFWKALRAELLASLLVAVFVTGSTARSPAREVTAATSSPPAQGQPQATAGSSDGSDGARMALAYALTTATLIQCLGSVSGAHANPAVTLGLLVRRLVSPLRAAAYVTAQLAGGLAGALILYGLTPAGVGHGDQVAAVRPGVSLPQAFGAELLATFIPVLTTLAALEPVREDVGCKALSVGLAYGVGALFAVYWVGPLFGGLLGGFTYEFVHEASPRGRLVRRSFRRSPGTTGGVRGHLSAPIRGQPGREVSGFSSVATDCLQLSATEEGAAVTRH
ncbi:Neurogenic protein big brain [Amphibalanus amphitrite]|uniref:Neurogenic protein big brain n=1 Tax=Amphibalanus amphitrite TaxID=1232801 RepID=A0A6A4WT78_AMPAM|nr:Neurogenic protein big brain [Amphibalanus amphitrite]